MIDIFCPACGAQSIFLPGNFRCDCGSAWEPGGDGLPLKEGRISTSENSVWRYADFFGSDDFCGAVSLGVGWTPLVRADWRGHPVTFKLEYLSPTGSFKDRGTEVEMAFLKAAGVEHVVEDSSGNAGASLAAYAAKAGIRAHIYAPDSAPRAKLDQIAVYGAALHLVPGARIQATDATLRAVESGAVYASHAYNPVYLLGQETFAWEIWEQTGGNLPDAVIIPVGQGGLLLGAWLGFSRLVQSGLAGPMPKLFAAQPAALAPIYQATMRGLNEIPETIPNGRSVADGLMIAKPVRGRRLLQALRESGGGALAVTEEEIKVAYFQLANLGLFVEPTSAVAAAALPSVRKMLDPSARVLVALTGCGMKTPLLVK